ncbi:hypothetical protein [Dishui Lake phycodnavirus 4]|nr:hypothetical protein [Dishui Lake phycodnavirus 4]
MMSEIEKLINEEVERRLLSRLTKYAENISIVHGIPLRLVLRDIPKNDIGDTRCKGLLKSGKRCSRNFKTDGYCLLHVHQKKSSDPITIVSDVIHNHPFPPLFMQGCPACEHTRKEKGPVSAPNWLRPSTS